MKANWNKVQEKLPKLFPWGFVFMLAIGLIVLPAYQCPMKKQEEAAPKKGIFTKKNKKPEKVNNKKKSRRQNKRNKKENTTEKPKQENWDI